MGKTTTSVLITLAASGFFLHHETKAASTVCDESPCNLQCQYGYADDVNGCMICGCIDPCAEVKCNNKTECVVEKDEFNKFIGKCATVAACGESPCNLECQYGYADDINGCKICGCIDPCSEVECPENMQCRVEKNGSSSYSRRCVSGCAHTACDKVCEIYAKDENGCNTCDCSSDPCINVTCTSGSKCVSDEDGTKCVVVANPCGEIECRLECAGHGVWNRYLNCSACNCDNPCLDSKCKNGTCLLKMEKTEREGKEVSVIVGECRNDQQCPKSACSGSCASGTKIDKLGCPSCACRSECDNKNCAQNMYCEEEVIFIFELENRLVRCTGCPKLECRNRCLFGWVGCSSCKCAENPCSASWIATQTNISCLPLFFPTYSKFSERRVPSSNSYQDYIYLRKQTGKCFQLRQRYIEYLNVYDSVNCDSHGDFKSLQCSNEDNCWCLDKDGKTQETTTKELSIATCGFHSKQLYQLQALDDMNSFSDDSVPSLKIYIAKSLSSLLGMEEQKVITTNVTSLKSTSGPAKLNVVVLHSSENESHEVQELIKSHSRKTLNLNYYGKTLRFTFVQNIPLPSKPTHLSPSGTSSRNTRFYLITILVPTLVVLLVALILITIGFFIVEALRRAVSTTASISEEPIISSEKYKNDIYCMPTSVGSEV